MAGKKASTKTAKQATALLVELRTEEMPPLLLDGVAANLAANLVQDLASNRLCAADAAYQYWFTPRRIAVQVEAVAQRSADQGGTRRGPAVKRAYGPDKKPTQALEGFLRSAGAATKDLLRETHKGEEYVAVKRGGGGRPLQDVLGPALQRAVAKTAAPRLMSWNGGQDRFLRPIRGVYAVHGAKALKLPQVFGRKSLDHTLGHRFLHQGKTRIKNAASYAQDMQRSQVIVDAKERAASIRKQAAKLARDVIIDAELLREAANMCEQPTCYMVEFDKAFLELPVKVIETCMGKHLRSFAVGKKKLRNKFIFVADNKPRDDAKLRKGLARVMHARLEDTKFIYDLDRKVRSEELLERISAIKYIHGMGSMFDRSKRIERLVSDYAQPLNLQQNEIEYAKGASEYIKADLGLKLVDEYPELEGHIGGALLDRPAAVKALIGGHLDRSLDDQPNPPRDALVLALELERLVTIVAIDGLPKGSRDPRGLRRAMGRIIRILKRQNSADLNQLLQHAWEECHQAAGKYGALKDNLFVSDADGLRCSIKRFAIERIGNMASELIGSPIPRSMRNAVFEPMLEDCGPSTELHVLPILERIEGLYNFNLNHVQQFNHWMYAAKRLGNISERHQGGPVRPELLKDPTEKNLYDARNKCDAETKKLEKNHQYVECYIRLATLGLEVERFFDNVMVNVDDAAVRTNRLNLVCSVSHLINKFSDTRKLYS